MTQPSLRLYYYVPLRVVVERRMEQNVERTVSFEYVKARRKLKTETKNLIRARHAAFPFAVCEL